MNANLYSLFYERFQDHLGDVCFEAPCAGTWTYGDIHRLSGQFAAKLAVAGIRPGDRVVAQVEKSVGAVCLYLGCLRAGGVFVPLNTAYTPGEVEYFLADAEPRVFVCRPGAEETLSDAAARANVAHVLPLGETPDANLWRDVLALAPADGFAERDAGDLASILYTSGTTGRSKGAMLSHGALASNALTLHEIWGFESGDVLLHALPIFHIHGLFVALHTAFLNASKIIFLREFKAGEVRKHLGSATILMGVPTFYSRLLEEEGFGPTDCASMRLFISGSAPLTAPASEAWTARTGHKILERYGMTEAGMIASNPLTGDRIPGTVGYALPGIGARISDDAGMEVPRGDVGVIQVKGPNLFSGYWRLPEKTAEEMRPDGYFITGDLGIMEADGRIRIVGRAKDLVISGGYNIYPKEIESVLDAIDGVKESAVIGVPHPDLGEGVVAVLVADKKPVEDSVLKLALEKGLARFKHPRRFYWIGALPRNAMGKVQKNALRETHADAYKA